MMREVQAYKDKWGRPAWPELIEPDEFALLIKHFQTGTDRFPDGSHPTDRASVKCYVFPNLDEAIAFAQPLVKTMPSLTCIIFNKSEKKIKSISNIPAILPSAIARWFSIFITVAFVLGIGAVVLGLIGKVFSLILLFNKVSAWVIIIVCSIFIGCYFMWQYYLYLGRKIVDATQELLQNNPEFQAKMEKPASAIENEILEMKEEPKSD